MERSEVLQQLKEIILTEIPDGSASVYLFGSWARNTERASSDIDVAIAFDASVQYRHAIMQRLRDVVEESNIPYHVDLVDLDQMDVTIAEKVKKEGIAWAEPKNE
jgi:hypothetical protein